MNDDPHSDLEARLHAWRPAEMPPALGARLRAAGPAPRRSRQRTLSALAGALVAVGVVGFLASRFVTPADPVDGRAPGGSPTLRRPSEPDRFAETRWMLGESLTMNLGTGLPPDVAPAAWRLDGGPIVSSGLILVRSPDGKLPLKVDCQF